MRRCHPRD